MQVDLQPPMTLNKVWWRGNPIAFNREGDIYYIEFPYELDKNSVDSLKLEFSGNPRVAKRPPWDGGWIFSKDQKGRPWMTVACQGLGASVWFPCKDHQSDEPDEGVNLHITVPDTLIAVGNGRLYSIAPLEKGKKTYSWTVSSPINSYCIIPYIGKYEHFSEVYQGEAGPLDCDYWVLDYEKEKAVRHFEQVPVMLKSFEHWFGPYPFYKDGYKLVQAPHLGMEHQSAVAYGNKFQNGYLGRDLSESGWGNRWDFIIVHESGHEWFGNNITTADIADMWIHEGFTNYSETLFTTSQYGNEAGNDYVIGTRKLIENDIPIIGPYGVNREGSGDMYYKGGNLLHMIRMMMNDDEAFRGLLREMNLKWKHKVTSSSEIESFIIDKTGIALKPVFEQYLRTTQIPVLQYRIREGKIQCRWTECVPGFTMNVKMNIDGKATWIAPGTDWTTIAAMAGAVPDIRPDRNFYIQFQKVD
jgi:aminopeptidase N